MVVMAEDESSSVVRHGMILQRTSEGLWAPMRLQLTNETLSVQRDVTPKRPKSPQPQSNHTETKKEKPNPTEIRTIILRRQTPKEGLGLSIKGGSDFNLPILVSRILAGKAADNSGQLFVGDAILKINGASVETLAHDQVVEMLRSSTGELTLVVRHVAQVSDLLCSVHRDENSQQKDPLKGQAAQAKSTATTPTSSAPPGSPRMDKSPRSPRADKVYEDVETIRLCRAYITRRTLSQNDKDLNAFEVIGLEGRTTGLLRCDNDHLMSEWVNCIVNNITAADCNALQDINRTLSEKDSVHFMCWVELYKESTDDDQTSNTSTGASCLPTSTVHPETALKSGTSKENSTKPLSSDVCNPDKWIRKYLVLKGSDCLLFSRPPSSLSEWISFEKQYRIYECQLKPQSVTGSQVLNTTDETQATKDLVMCLRSAHGDWLLLAVETRHQALQLEKAWYQASLDVIQRIQPISFIVTVDNQPCSLEMDLANGLRFIYSRGQAVRQFRFSQIIESSDDGRNRLVLQLINSNNTSQVVEIQCSALNVLLFCLHSLMAAKISLKDPYFLRST